MIYGTFLYQGINYLYTLMHLIIALNTITFFQMIVNIFRINSQIVATYTGYISSYSKA